jgi:flagellar biosynthesis/type III secretory pathway M-ring protein FliF/YscJ
MEQANLYANENQSIQQKKEQLESQQTKKPKIWLWILLGIILLLGFVAAMYFISNTIGNLSSNIAGN